MTFYRWTRLVVLMSCGTIIAACATEGSVWAQGSVVAMQQINPDMPAPLRIDADRVAAQQIEKISGKYLTLYTDVRDGIDSRELVDAFDSAVPQWCELLNIEPSRTAGWHLSGFLMADKDRFRAAGLLPESLPAFPAGYNLGHHFWVLPQPGNYYTRHLVLHEGTHAFMQWFLAGSGPPWYSEGMAEKFALHTWGDGKLKLNVRPTSTEQVAYWGRPRIIREANSTGKLLLLDEIFEFPDNAFRNVDSYAWAWAACDFLSHHPKTQETFAKLPATAKDRTARFSLLFKRPLQRHWAQIEIDWLQYLAELDYGAPPEKAILTKVTPQPIDGAWSFDLATDVSWQDTGIKVAAGEQWLVHVSGMYTVRQFDSDSKQKNWQTTANGITVEYHRQRPLGQLLIGVVGDTPKKTGVIKPLERNEQGFITIDKPGRLALRINEFPGALADNQGNLKIRLEKKSAGE